MDEQIGQDYLSDLPVSLIESILMLLPVKEAIRTSILSTNWRYKWTRLPQLLFDEEDMISSERIDANHEKRLKNIVSRTLLHHEGPILKFGLSVECMDSCRVTDQWLRFLSRRYIKELTIDIDGPKDEYFHLTSCLYSCRNLTLLNLWGCQLRPPPPTFKGFLYLRSLVLHLVKVSSDVIESIVASSPLLEMFDCVYSGVSKLRISAPNLKYVCLIGSFREIHLCAPLLAKMDITLEDNTFEAEQKLWVCNYTKLLGGFTNLETLIGAEYFTKYLSVGIEYCRPLVFHHLKVIELYRVNFEDVDEILVLVRLIMDAAASLHELRVLIKCACVGEDAAQAPLIHGWNSEWLRNCTFKKLKVINVMEFHGAPQQINFIQKLLESSPVLETIIIEQSQSLTSSEETMNSIFELSRHPRASSNAKFLV